MFSFFRRKSKQKKESKIKSSTTSAVSSQPNASNNDVKRWSDSVKLSSNNTSNSNQNLKSRNVLYEEDEEGEEGFSKEDKENALMYAKLQLLRNPPSNATGEKTPLNGIAGGRTLNRRSMDPSINNVSGGLGIEGVEDTPLSGSLTSRKSVKKLRRKEVSSFQLPSHLSTDSSTLLVPSRISHYWHDYNDNTKLPASNVIPATVTPSPPTNKSPKIKQASNELASRLSELAISHTDGLLNEEEYRMLRTQVFIKFAGNSNEVGIEIMGSLSSGSEEVPKLDDSLFIPKAFGSPSNIAAPIDLPTRAPSLNSLTSRARSSIANSSIFGKNRKPSLEEDWDVVNPQGLKITDILNHQIENESYNYSSPSSPILPTSPALLNNNLNLFQPRSLRNYPGLSVPGSVSGPSGTSTTAALNNQQSPRISYIQTPTSPTSPNTRTSLNAFTFSQPNRSSLAPIASSLDPFIFATTEAEPTSNELKIEISSLERELSRLAETWDGLETVEIKKWELKLGPIGLNHFINFNSKPPSELSSLDQDDLNLTLPEDSLERTKVLDSKDSRLSNLDLKTSTLPSVSSRQALHAISKPPIDNLAEEVEIASEELIGKVDQIRTSKRSVEEKYEERLAYLRARLSAALLKERLLAQ